ncbi:hypothetical protein N8Z64_07970, partial [Pseudomonadales bacterium]|nr:hypothetical protein [Pseudomonadales bacterium]
IATLEQRMDNLLSRVSLNESRLDGVDAAIAWLQKQNSELAQVMSDLDAGLASAEDIVASMKAENAVFQTELDSFGDYFYELEGEIALNEEMIDVLNLSLVESVRVIEERLNENDFMLSELYFIAEDVQNQLALKQNVISGSCFENERLVSIEENGSLICETIDENPVNGLRVAQVSKIIEIDTSTWRSVYEGYSHKFECHNRVGGYFEVPSSLRIKTFPSSTIYNITNPKISFSGDKMAVNVVYEDHLRFRRTTSHFVKLSLSCLVLEGEQGVLIRTD